MSRDEFIHVPYGCTVHGQDEIDAVVHVLETSTQMGKHVRSMEQRCAKLYNKKFGVMLNSGSSANYLAIELLNMPEGSEVITPVLTFSTTVAPLIRNKLTPVFIDVEEGTYNIDANQIEELITDKTKLVMIPNLLGNLPDWKKIRELADKYNLILVEDSCDTLGATIDGKSSGRFTDMSTTSFYGSHVVNCAGNGGMLCVNEEKFAQRAQLLRSWGRSSSLFVESEAIENRFNVDVDGVPYDAKFVFEALGYNLEPSEVGAAFGLIQLDKLSKNIDSRNHWFNQQLEFFKQYEEWFILPKTLPSAYTGWLAFPLTIKDSAPFSRRDMQIYLEKRNIQTRTIFTGNVLRQPGFANIVHKAHPNGYKNANQVMKGGVLLACHHGLTQAMLEHMHESFTLFADQYSVQKQKKQNALIQPAVNDR